MKETALKYKINKVHWISSDEKRAYVNVTWGDNEHRDELRRVWKDTNGEMKLGKGIFVEADDLEAIVENLKRIGRNGGKKPVNFEKVFDDSSGIIEKREQGYTTDDGFIRLMRRTSL